MKIKKRPNRFKKKFIALMLSDFVPAKNIEISIKTADSKLLKKIYYIIYKNRNGLQ